METRGYIAAAAMTKGDFVAGTEHKKIPFEINSDGLESIPKGIGVTARQGRIFNFHKTTPQ